MLPIYYTIADKSRAIKYIHNWKREHISIIKKTKRTCDLPRVFCFVLPFFAVACFFIFVYSSQIIKKTKVHLSCKRKMHSVWRIDLKRKLLVFVSLICHLLPFKYATLYLRIICHNIQGERDTWCQILNTYAHICKWSNLCYFCQINSAVTAVKVPINDVAKSSNNNNRRLLS